MAPASVSLLPLLSLLSLATIYHASGAEGLHAPLAPAAPPTITDFWNGNAHFSLIAKTRFDEYDMAVMNVGFHFVTRGTTWYLFHREYNFAPRPAYCTADFARIVVRKSEDEGSTWSDPVVVATPPIFDPSTTTPQAPDECALTDGAGYYDEAADTWHYLSQCNNRTRIWNLCHYSLKGSDPMVGNFTKNPANPVVVGGQLWSQICAGRGKNCDPHTHDEGTPEIVTTDADGYHYVTFHGCNDGATRSARGVAKTKDFVAWETQGENLPNDAIFGQVDCNKWNVTWAKGTCVGGGEGTILTGPDGYMYHLIEVVG